MTARAATEGAGAAPSDGAPAKRSAAGSEGGARKRVRRPDESEREELVADSRDVDVWLVKVPPYLMEEWNSRRA